MSLPELLREEFGDLLTPISFRQLCGRPVAHEGRFWICSMLKQGADDRSFSLKYCLNQCRTRG